MVMMAGMMMAPAAMVMMTMVMMMPAAHAFSFRTQALHICRSAARIDTHCGAGIARIRSKGTPLA
jgi:hypothetical protein